MERPEWAPVGIDLDRPSAARVYDFYLGGFHNFAADREMGRQAVQMWPDLPEIMQANRGFLRRAVEFLAGAGVRRFLDLGSGIPTVGNVHEVAQRVAPGSQVVYVDNDPVAVEHSRAILAGDPSTTVVQADLRDPDSVLARPAVQELLDGNEPVAVLMVAVLHFVPDEADPAALVARFRDASPPGSYLALSHATAGEQADRAAEHRSLYQRTATPMTMRSREQVMNFFDGYALAEPGVVYLPQWRPEPGTPGVDRPERMTGLAGVGHKP
ncbi:MAG TPA: SAM-dependent methyltransferase [Mycobacteriales bacterium]|nr:SAM-dependent methyltransferase [Mycobacteriales bacterium]